MRHSVATMFAALGALWLIPQAIVHADPKIEEQSLAPAGRWVGYTLSPKGVHAAVLASKGSRFAVLIDGVEGPRIDQMLGYDGSPYMSANTPQAREIPALFSDDGAHCAYFAKVGDEFILVLDGKELTRGKLETTAFGAGPLTFSAGGKHLYYLDSTGGYHIVMDGQPGPISHTPPKVVTSPDGAHYAYVGTKADGFDTPWGVVDGKQVNYFGNELQFTAKGHLVALLQGKGEMALNIDGKNAIVATNISQLSISPHGGEIAAIVYDAKTSQTLLNVNGKPVPGVNGATVSKVIFSPDDKRYAAFCNASNGQFVLLDGKKGQQYQSLDAGAGGITNGAGIARAWANGRAVGNQMMMDGATSPVPGFTADSSKFLYVAMTGGKSFLVADDDESDGFQSISPIVSADGKHVAFIGMSGTPKPTIILDGKTLALNGRAGSPSGGPQSFSFSPDGSHYVFNNGGVLYIDGVEQPDLNCAGQYMYSPDSKHLLLIGASPSKPDRHGVFLDGKLVTTWPGGTAPTFPTFTADSQHIFWIGSRPSESSTDHENSLLHVDGKPTALHFIESGPAVAGNWQVSADGALTFVAQTGDELKRFRITPGADSSITTMLAAGK